MALKVVGEFGRISAFAPVGGDEPSSFIDAEVTVQGVCFPLFNERAQVAGARIELNNAREIDVTRPPASDPFEAPLVALDELQAFSPEGVSFHRQRTRATVTLVRPRDFIYVQNDTESMRINLADEAEVRPGDRIEAVGFARPGVRFVEWQHALVRKIGDGPVPKAISTSRADVLRLVSPLDDRTTGDFDGRLITISGRLKGVEATENNERRIFIDCDGQVVNALLAAPPAGDTIDALRIGSTVRVTGVCQVDYTEHWPTPVQARPVDMRLLLRGPDDITVIRAASWWTPGRLRIALMVLGALLLAALPWLRSLRRQVGERTRELASETRARQDAEIEFRATLRERERVAADMHDTAEQALTGVSYQLAIADRLQDTDPQRGREHLQLAKQLLSQSREDVRQSVWNLRAQTLNGRPLAEVLRDIAAGLSAKHDTDAEVRVTGSESAIPERVAGHLVLLARESMTNAIKHADPDKILLTLAFGDDTVELTVEDDGRGFDPATAPGMGEGHMGLQGMRERVKRLDGALHIDSQPGHGTTIRATVPVSR
jgi:signal transduction histidine kinase